MNKDWETSPADMYKSIEELTARLKCLDLKVKFDIQYQTDIVSVKHNGNTANHFHISLDSIDDKPVFSMNGFTPSDKKQKIKITLLYQDKELPIRHICKFSMRDNKYVNNQDILNYDEIYFNGNLTLDFDRHWFETHILGGIKLRDYFLWNKADFEKQTIFCVGCSYTQGHGVEKNETWPSMIPDAYNFGANGISHVGCLSNIQYILKHSRFVKKIICLLPIDTRQQLTINFLGSNGLVPINVHAPHWSMPDVFKEAAENIRMSIFRPQDSKDSWITTCNEIIDCCREHQVQCLMSTWAQDLHQYIPESNRLPVFPKLDLFEERATDGRHPHKKHYEYWVKQIIPYIDKS